MDHKENQKIDYGKLFHALAGHWKPVFQNKEFRYGMLRWVVGTIFFVAFGIFMLSLNPTGKTLSKFMKEIEPPPGAVLIDTGGIRNGLNYFYKFPGMSEEEVRAYYKKALTEKKWIFKEKYKDGTDVYSKLGDRGEPTYQYSFIVQKSRFYTEKGEYDWRLRIYEEKYKK